MILMRRCCLSGNFFYSNYNKKSVIAEKDSVNLEITHTKNFVHSMSNHYSGFNISASITDAAHDD